MKSNVFPLTVTLNWDTEMLFVWTLRRTHCLMSDAKRRGSDERSHFSFLVHLENKNVREGVLFTDDKCTYTHESSNLTRAYPVQPVGTWEKENVLLLPDGQT